MRRVMGRSDGPPHFIHEKYTERAQDQPEGGRFGGTRDRDGRGLRRCRNCARRGLQDEREPERREDPPRSLTVAVP